MSEKSKVLKTFVTCPKCGNLRMLAVVGKMVMFVISANFAVPRAILPSYRERRLER